MHVTSQVFKIAWGGDGECHFFTRLDQSSIKVGKVGKVDKVDKVGKVRKVRKVGKVGKGSG